MVLVAHNSFINAVPNRFTAIINPIQHFIFDQAIKLCSINRKDIAKECTRFILPYLITKQIFATINSYQLTSDHVIDYGCEAAWAGYYEGVETIPGALMRYAFIDACYCQLKIGACYYNLDFPQSFKKHAMLCNLSRVLMPLLVKRCIGLCLDHLFKSLQADQTGDAMESFLDAY